MSSKETESRVTDLVAEDLSAAGYELVRVQMTSGGRFVTLQVMAERTDGKPMTVDDCVKISHTVSAKLDEADPMAGKYTLEVSSPGIDRPLVKVKDFERFQGHLARIELEAPMGGQRRFQGSIIRVSGAEAPEVELKTDQGNVKVPMKTIARAKLVMTDELLGKKVKQDTNTKH